MNVTVYGVFENVKYLWFFIATSQTVIFLYIKVIAFKNNGKIYALFNVVKMATDIFGVIK